MHQSEIEVPGAAVDFSLGFGLWYDADRLVLEGVYQDEITAYRARKRWIQTLEANFLLEEQHDFRIKVRIDGEAEHYQVRCDFLSACGRYAFWRLTHHQAPEVQYMLETAHLPSMTVVPTHTSFPEQQDLFASESCVIQAPSSSTAQSGTRGSFGVRAALSAVYRRLHRFFAR